MINSFIDFAKTGKIHNNNQLLNEDLVSLQQQFFNKKSIGFLLWAASVDRLTAAQAAAMTMPDP